MHTNRLWYVNKTTYFLSRSIYVHVVELIHFVLVQFTFRQQYIVNLTTQDHQHKH